MLYFKEIAHSCILNLCYIFLTFLNNNYFYRCLKRSSSVKYRLEKRWKKKKVLWKRSGFLSHPLNETSVVEAPAGDIGTVLLQRVRKLSAFAILVDCISKHFLSLNLLDTI